MICVHWFNPLVYFIRKEINRCCELSCDENVIKKLDFDGRIEYGDTLITSLNAQGNCRSFNLSLTMGENAKLIKERLDMMMNYKKKSKFIVGITFLLTITFLCSFSFLGVSASAPNSSNTTLKQDNSLDANKIEKIKNITLSIKNANVTVQLSKTNQILYDFDNTKYNILSTMNGSNLEIKVGLLEESQFASLNEIPTNPIIIYLPEKSYDNVTVEGRNSNIYLPGFDANLNLTSNYGAMEIQVPENFNKSINLAHQNGAGSLVIDSKAKDYEVNVKSESSMWILPDLLDYTQNETGKYNNGKGTAQINVNLKYSSFAIQLKDTKETTTKTSVSTKQDTNKEASTQDMETTTLGGETWCLVETEAQLRAIGTGNYGLDKNYLLNADIDVSSEEWIPIGTFKAPFTGRFNGNGFVIKNLTITNPDIQIIGMFGYADNATIDNVILQNYDILSAGSNVKGKSVAPILVFGNHTKTSGFEVYPKVEE
jgi:hypothetical protein